MEEADFFFGAAILLIVQCLIAGTINLYKSKASNKLLGILIFLFLDYYRYILYGFCINQELLNALLLAKFTLSQFYGPILFLFLYSIIHPINSRHFRNHLVIPGLYTGYLLVVIGVKYLYGISIYEFSLEVKSMLVVVYLWLGFKLIRSKEWEKIKLSRRYTFFFYIAAIYLLVNQVIRIITWSYELSESLRPVFGFLEKGSFIIVNNYLFIFGLTQINALKKLFVPYYSESEVVKLNGHGQDVKDKIEAAVREGIYKDSVLSLEIFANEIGITKSQLSDFFKTYYKSGFTEQINYWRLEEFKKSINDEKLAHLDLLGLAHEAGFNSKATFNRYFKKKEGITPSEYRKNLIKARDTVF